MEQVLALQQKELKDAEEAAACQGSDGDAAQRLQALALEESVSRRWIAGEEELELVDETTSFTTLWTHLLHGDVMVVSLLALLVQKYKH